MGDTTDTHKLNDWVCNSFNTWSLELVSLYNALAAITSLNCDSAKEICLTFDCEVLLQYSDCAGKRFII